MPFKDIDVEQEYKDAMIYDDFLKQNAIINKSNSLYYTTKAEKENALELITGKHPTFSFLQTDELYKPLTDKLTNINNTLTKNLKVNKGIDAFDQFADNNFKTNEYIALLDKMDQFYELTDYYENKNKHGYLSNRKIVEAYNKVFNTQYDFKGLTNKIEDMLKGEISDFYPKKYQETIYQFFEDLLAIISSEHQEDIDSENFRYRSDSFSDTIQELDNEYPNAIEEAKSDDETKSDDEYYDARSNISSQQGGGIYTNKKDLNHRFQLLLGMNQAGNKNKKLINELISIITHKYKKNEFGREKYKKLLGKIF